MDAERAREHARNLAGGELQGERLHRHFKFKDFQSVMRFVNDVAELAEAEGHHPDLHVHDWNQLEITTWTHAIGGLSENDFILAAKIDALPSGGAAGRT